MGKTPEPSASAGPGRDRLAGAASAAIVIVVAVGAYTLHKLMSPANPPSWIYEIDLRGYFFPSLAYSGARLAEGVVPLWAPGQMLGVPFAAALQPAVFYPLLLPFVLLLETGHALVAHGLVHLALAGVFTWIYLRTTGLAWAAALVGALAYMFSPEITHSLYNTAFLSNRVWLPALFAAVHVVVENPTRARCATLAGVTAMLFLSGSAQGTVYSLEAGAFYALVRMTASARGAGFATTTACLAAGGMLGLAMAAVQLVPTFELVSDGVRSLGGVGALRAGGIGGEEASVAGSLGTVLMRQVGGLAGVFFVLAALADRSIRGLALLMLALLLVTCDFQRGNAGWVFPIYFALPTGNLFTVSTRIDYVSGFAAACLAGLGMQALLAAMKRLPRPLVSSVTAVVTAVVTAAVLWPRYNDDRTPRAWPPLVDGARMRGETAVVEQARDAAGHDRVFVYQHPQDQRIPARAGLVSGARVLYDYEPLLPGSYRRFFSIDADLRWRGRLTPVAHTAAVKGGDFDVTLRVLDSLAVREYVDARGKPGLPVQRTTRATALPRAYAVDHVAYAASDEAALAIVHGEAFDPLRDVVLTSAASVLDENTDALVSDVRITTDGAQEVVLDASCSKPCVTVLSDLAYPGWEVEVDGSAAEVIQANFLLRAVAIPAGRHEIRYRYRPRSFVFGAGLSVVSALVVLALAFGRRRNG